MENNFLPHVVNVPLSSEVIDEALTKNLTTEQLLRVKAVEEAIRVVHGRPLKSNKDFKELSELINNFYTNENTKVGGGYSS